MVLLLFLFFVLIALPLALLVSLRIVRSYSNRLDLDTKTYLSTALIGLSSLIFSNGVFVYLIAVAISVLGNRVSDSTLEILSEFVAAPIALVISFLLMIFTERQFLNFQVQKKKPKRAILQEPTP